MPLGYFEVRLTTGSLVCFTKAITSYEDASKYLIEYVSNNVDEWGGFYWGPVSSHHVTIFSQNGARRLELEGHIGGNWSDLHNRLSDLHNQT